MTMKQHPYRRRVHYYETDQMGIAHHSNHIRWLEEARLEHMRNKGCSYVQLEARGILMPVVSVSCEYKTPVQFDDELMIEARLSFFNGVRVRYEYRICKAETGETVANGSSEHCFLDQSSRTPLHLKKAAPDVYRQMMQAAEEENK